jgi:hypothetical protein
MMVASSKSSNSAALLLRFYGLAAVGIGLVSLWICLGLKPGWRGISDPSSRWPSFVGMVLLGICVFLLFRWLVLLFTILLSGFGVFFLFASLRAVPFPWELINIFFALLYILPAYLTYRAWPRLR